MRLGFGVPMLGNVIPAGAVRVELRVKVKS